jgi:hypothetical protein
MARHLDELLQHYGLSGHAACQNGGAEQNHEARILRRARGSSGSDPPP